MGPIICACAAHLKGIFEHRTFIEVTVRELPDRYAEPARSEMKKCRNHYEQIFSKIIDEIPLHHAVDRLPSGSPAGLSGLDASVVSTRGQINP